jgi:PAB-dependent poly(A)-specific ribonuclease subunit 2
MAYYSPLHLLPLPPQARDAKPFPTAITIDPYADLLWLGSSGGLTTALCTPSTLTRNVQFPSYSAPSLNSAAFSVPSPVKEIRVTDREIWTLTESGISGRRRGGAAKWSIGDTGRGLRSMCMNPTNSHEVVAGGSGGLLVANTARSEIVRRVSSRPLMRALGADIFIGRSIQEDLSCASVLLPAWYFLQTYPDRYQYSTPERDSRQQVKLYLSKPILAV